MAWEGVLEGRNGDAALEGPRNLGPRGVLVPGPDWRIQIGSQRPGSEAGLQPVAQAVKRTGDQARE